MKKLRLYLAVLCCITIVAMTILLSAIGSSSAATTAAKSDVTVINAADNPVPVSVVNSPAIQVSSSDSNPVLVRDVDNAARHAFQNQITFGLVGGGPTQCGMLATVPDGKRLAIQYISVFVTIPGVVIRSRLRTALNGSNTNQDLDVDRVQDFPSVDGVTKAFRVTQQLQAYADATDPVEICIDKTFEGLGGNVHATVSGYFVDTP